jgi:hypothetical protein
VSKYTEETLSAAKKSFCKVLLNMCWIGSVLENLGGIQHNIPEEILLQGPFEYVLDWISA